MSAPDCISERPALAGAAMGVSDQLALHHTCAEEQVSLNAFGNDGEAVGVVVRVSE